MSKVDVEAAVNCIFNSINEELARGGRIEIGGLALSLLDSTMLKWVVIPEQARLYLFLERIASILNQEVN